MKLRSENECQGRVAKVEVRQYEMSLLLLRTTLPHAASHLSICLKGVRLCSQRVRSLSRLFQHVISLQEMTHTNRMPGHASLR